MKKLSFKDYIETKKQLLKAINECPVQSLEYEVVKYCKFVTESDESISLKPKQKIVVEWKYVNVNDIPTPVAIRFSEVKDVDSSVDFNTSWTPKKLNKWLQTNTSQID